MQPPFLVRVSFVVAASHFMRDRDPEFSSGPAQNGTNVSVDTMLMDLMILSTRLAVL